MVGIPTNGMTVIYGEVHERGYTEEIVVMAVVNS